MTSAALVRCADRKEAPPFRFFLLPYSSSFFLCTSLLPPFPPFFSCFFFSIFQVWLFFIFFCFVLFLFFSQLRGRCLGVAEKGPSRRRFRPFRNASTSSRRHFVPPSSSSSSSSSLLRRRRSWRFVGVLHRFDSSRCAPASAVICLGDFAGQKPAVRPCPSVVSSGSLETQ